MNRRDLAAFLNSPQAIREYEQSLASYTLTDLDEGYDNPDPDTPNPGTTIPTVPTPVAYSAELGVAIACDRQTNLTNFARYEWQVSDDAGVTAYALGYGGTGLGTVDTDTDIDVEFHVHRPLPLDVTGGADAPVDKTWHYRVRRVTLVPVTSAWSSWTSADSQVVGSGTLAQNSVYANNIVTAALQALFADVTTLSVGYNGAGSYASPSEGDSTLLIDDARMFLQKYLDGGWSDVNKLSFGVLAGAVLLGMMGCSGVIHPDAETGDLAELIPNDNFHLLTFETDYTDQNGVAPDSTANALRSNAWSKFGTWSLYATATALAYCQYDDVVGLTTNLGAGAWINITNAESSNSNLFHYMYARDVNNSLSIAIDVSGGKFRLWLYEKIGGGEQQAVSVSSAEDIATGEHYIAFVVDFDNTKLTLITDGNVVDTTFAALTLTEGATTTNRFRLLTSSLASPNLTWYADDVLFAYDDLCDPDFFVQHYLNNSGWLTDLTYNDLILRPGPDGKVMLADTLLESSVLSAVQAGAGIVEQDSNANGEYQIWSNGRVEMTMWGFVTGDGVNSIEADSNNTLPYPGVSSIEFVGVNLTGYKASDPTTRHDATAIPALEVANGRYDGTYLDVLVTRPDGAAITNGGRYIWNAHLIGSV